MINLKEVLTISEAAEIYKVDVSTLRKMLKTDKLKKDIDFRKSNSTWLINKKSLDNLYKNKSEV